MAPDGTPESSSGYIDHPGTGTPREAEAEGMDEKGRTIPATQPRRLPTDQVREEDRLVDVPPDGFSS